VLRPRLSLQFRIKFNFDVELFALFLPENIEKWPSLGETIRKYFPNVEELSLFCLFDQYSEIVPSLIHCLSSKLTTLHIDQLSTKKMIFLPDMNKIRRVYLSNTSGIHFLPATIQKLTTLQLDCLSTLDYLNSFKGVHFDKLESASFSSELLLHLYSCGIKFHNLITLQI